MHTILYKKSKVYQLCYTLDLLYSKLCIYHALQYAPFDVFKFHFLGTPL